MKYSIDEAMREIDERKDVLIKNKIKRSINAYLAMAVLVSAGLLAAIYGYAGFGEIDGTYSVYGSFMLPDEAGGYIVVAVLSFVAAVVITVLCIRWKDRRKK